MHLQSVFTQSHFLSVFTAVARHWQQLINSTTPSHSPRSGSVCGPRLTELSCEDLLGTWDDSVGQSPPRDHSHYLLQTESHPPNPYLTELRRSWSYSTLYCQNLTQHVQAGRLMKWEAEMQVVKRDQKMMIMEWSRSASVSGKSRWVWQLSPGDNVTILAAIRSSTNDYIRSSF